ncbi:MAG TPA: M64 family metallopeptidase [Polyangiaceae bacterium]|nr:M64 family metallopeptidase [Polyangiaceae bacterium]
MKIRPLRFQLSRAAAMSSFFLAISCSSDADYGPGTGGIGMGTGGSAPSSGGAQTQGGALNTFGGMAGSSGGSPATSGGAGGMSPASGGATLGGAAGAPINGAGASGSAGKGGAGGTAGAPSSGGTAGMPPAGGSGGATMHPPLDCGPQGWAVENNGPPKNRVNYVILGDGYTAASVDTALKTHIEKANQRRFQHESGEPYGRYRKFVNICVMKAISQSEGIGNGPTAFDGGNGGDRLASVNQTKVNEYLKANVPASFEIDWKAVVLNQSKWENTGSVLMLWSGAHADAPGAALHEGGHGFHDLADEYGATTGCPRPDPGPSCTGNGTVHGAVNSAGNCMTTDNKWNLWLGTTQKGMKVPDLGATGPQATWLGSRYVGTGQYRPSCNSMMNSLFGENVNTSFNSVSREQIVFSIWRAVVPIDSTNPPAGPVNNPATLQVNVIDPAVINVDWTVNGTTMINAGTTFSTASLPSGTHMISAKAYDNATEDLVRLRTGVCPPSVSGRYCHGTSWPRSTQTVTWTVTKP